MLICLPFAHSGVLEDIRVFGADDVERVEQRSNLSWLQRFDLVLHYFPVSEFPKANCQYCRLHHIHYSGHFQSRFQLFSLYLCDFSHGGGEIVRSAVNAKVSEEATSSGVRVCVWAQDPRKIFAEIGRAVGRSQLSKLYVDGKLVVPGHQPCPNPGPRPERTRKLVKAMLPEPLKVCPWTLKGTFLFQRLMRFQSLAP